jgi:RNA polymerase sigma factor (sigma-70 family)
VASARDRLLEILKAHGAELYALLTRLTLRAAVADDLLQELFVRLWVAPVFERAGNQKAYVFRTAIHLAFDWRRSRRPAEPLRQELAAPVDSPLEHLIGAEELARVLDAMEDLSELGRQVLVMRYLQQQDYTQIALQLGKTEHQTRGLCHKALGQLRSLLSPAVGESQGRGTEA